MGTLDFIIIGLLVLAAVIGWKSGGLRQLFGILSLVLAFVLAVGPLARPMTDALRRTPLRGLAGRVEDRVSEALREPETRKTLDLIEDLSKMSLSVEEDAPVSRQALFEAFLTDVGVEKGVGQPLLVRDEQGRTVRTTHVHELLKPEDEPPLGRAIHNALALPALLKKAGYELITGGEMHLQSLLRMPPDFGPDTTLREVTDYQERESGGSAEGGKAELQRLIGSLKDRNLLDLPVSAVPFLAALDGMGDFAAAPLIREALRRVMTLTEEDGARLEAEARKAVGSFTSRLDRTGELGWDAPVSRFIGAAPALAGEAVLNAVGVAAGFVLLLVLFEVLLSAVFRLVRKRRQGGGATGFLNGLSGAVLAAAKLLLILYIVCAGLGMRRMLAAPGSAPAEGFESGSVILNRMTEDNRITRKLTGKIRSVQEQLSVLLEGVRTAG